MNRRGEHDQRDPRPEDPDLSANELQHSPGQVCSGTLLKLDFIPTNSLNFFPGIPKHDVDVVNAADESLVSSLVRCGQPFRTVLASSDRDNLT